jgi:ribosome maturation factor RimP
MGWGNPPYFMSTFSVHADKPPYLQSLWQLIEPTVAALDLEIVGLHHQTHHNPPILRVDIRNPQQDTGLADCERVSRAIEPILDGAEHLLPEAYVLEVSSPGAERNLTTDREFQVFRGFSVAIHVSPPIKGKSDWRGKLLERTEDAVVVMIQGRKVPLPRGQVTQVLLTH